MYKSGRLTIEVVTYKKRVSKWKKNFLTLLDSWKELTEMYKSSEKKGEVESR